MTEDPNDSPDPQDPVVDPKPDPVTPPAPEPKTFTQDEVNRFNTKSKREGEKAAMENIAKRLNMSVEDAEKQLQAFHAKQDDEKTEMEKLREQNETFQKESAAKATQLQKEHHTDKVKYRLSRANLSLPEDGTEAEKALDRFVGLVSVEVGASAEDIDSNIDELKEQFPLLFQVPEKPEEPKGNPSSTLSGVPRKPSLSGKSPAERARDRAAEANAKRGVTTPTA